MNRNIKAEGPNELRVGDITFLPIFTGSLILVSGSGYIRQAHCRMVDCNHLRQELEISVLDVVPDKCKPGNVIHFSDQGSQYTFIDFGKCCKEVGVR